MDIHILIGRVGEFSRRHRWKVGIFLGIQEGSGDDYKSQAMATDHLNDGEKQMQARNPSLVHATISQYHDKKKYDGPR